MLHETPNDPDGRLSERFLHDRGVFAEFLQNHRRPEKLPLVLVAGHQGRGARNLVQQSGCSIERECGIQAVSPDGICVRFSPKRIPGGHGHPAEHADSVKLLARLADASIDTKLVLVESATSLSDPSSDQLNRNLEVLRRVRDALPQIRLTIAITHCDLIPDVGNQFAHCRSGYADAPLRFRFRVNWSPETSRKSNCPDMDILPEEFVTNCRHLVRPFVDAISREIVPADVILSGAMAIKSGTGAYISGTETIESRSMISRPTLQMFRFTE
jgi:hypothetical protein